MSASAWVDAATIVTAAIAVVMALFALLSDRWFRDRDGLSALLARFESGEFHTRLWRVEQISRPPGGEQWSIEPFDIDGETARLPVFLQAIAADWEHGGATMLEMYFFALRVHAWLNPVWWRWPRGRRARLLNSTFGHQLLVALLDHRVIACRLHRRGYPDTYYPTHYGCLDAVYRDLVTRLWNDLKSRTETPPEEVRVTLKKRFEATENHLAAL